MVQSDTKLTATAKRVSTGLSKSVRSNPVMAGMIDSVLHKLIKTQNERSLGCLCIGIASDRPRVGVSTIVYRLAAQAASNGDGSLLIVDANGNKPCQHRLTGVPQGFGLSDHLIDGVELEQCIHPSTTKYLDVLQWGSAKSSSFSVSPAELQGLFAELRNRYQVIFVDLPVIADAGNGLFFSMMTDGVVIALDGISSRAADTRDLVSLLGEHGVSIHGAIMNRYSPPLPRWIRRWF